MSLRVLMLALLLGLIALISGVQYALVKGAVVKSSAVRGLYRVLRNRRIAAGDKRP